jgi:hypothetical protein
LARAASQRSRSGLLVLSFVATSIQLGLLLHAAVVMTALKLSAALNTCDRRVRRVELTAKGRALIIRGFGGHAAVMEDVAGVLSKNERLTLLRLLKKLGKHAAETRQ